MSALLEYLRSCSPALFQTVPMYSSVGDYVTIFFEDVPCFVEVIGEYVEVYRANADRRIVGVKTYRVSLLLQPS